MALAHNILEPVLGVSVKWGHELFAEGPKNLVFGNF